MPVAQTVGDLAWVAVFGVGFGLLVIIVGFILYNIFGKKKARQDTIKEMYKEMIEDAKINLPDHMLHLYRVPIPFLGDFIGKITDDTSQKATVNELKTVLGKHRKSVYLGEIVGFNRIDLIATLEDLVMPEGKYDDPLKLKKDGGTLGEQDIKDIITLVEKCGRYLNFIAYKPKKKGLTDFPKDEGILAFDDMLLGVESEDGIVTLLGDGTDKIAVYFSIPAGYPERMKVTLTYLIERGWIRWAMRLESVHIESTEDAMRLDTTSQKMMTFSALQSSGGPNRRQEPTSLK
jgi:hypothetical protein